MSKLRRTSFNTLNITFHIQYALISSYVYLVLPFCFSILLLCVDIAHCLHAQHLLHDFPSWKTDSTSVALPEAQGRVLFAEFSLMQIESLRREGVV